MQIWLQPARFGVLLGVAAALLSAWWGVHHLPNPDEGAVLTNAVKVLHGGVFYRDIDAYPYPAANYAVALAMAVFGESVGVGRALAGAVFCATVLALYLAAVPLLGRARAALFGTSLLAFKLLGFPVFTTYSYWDLSFCFGCLALPLVLVDGPRRRRRLFLAGLFLAISFAAKQSVGIYLAAALLLQLALPHVFLRTAPVPGRERLRRVGALAAGLAAGVVPLFGYFGARGVLPAMLYSGFVRPFTGYLPTSGIPAGYMLAWWDFGATRADNVGGIYLPLVPWHLLMAGAAPFEDLYGVYWAALEALARGLYTSLPLVFVWPLWLWLRSWRGGGPVSVETGRLFLLAQLAFGFVLSAFPRADWAHVISVYPVVWLLIFASWTPGRRAARLEAVGVAVLLGVCAGLTGALHARATYHLQLERADLWIEPQTAWLEPVVLEIQRRVPPGAPFFVYGHEAHVYFLADRYNSWPYAQLYPGQTGPGTGRAVVKQLRREPPRMIFRGMLGWPGTPWLPGYAPALHRFLQIRYEEDTAFFERHPPPAGSPPEHFVAGVLLLRKRPGALPEPPGPSAAAGSR
ncbi:MAG: hypothetical protein JRG76_00665 [Deltaproteobacteria bacterium]|nr:hypothetical protein [Deltaproteobacteria bacterium]MBW2412993.1 hypothetical protein [Deltaproteobacteria bacterium]